MNISKHAVVRSQQRGIPTDDIDLIMQFGKPQYKPGGAIEYSKVDPNVKTIFC